MALKPKIGPGGKPILRGAKPNLCDAPCCDTACCSSQDALVTVSGIGDVPTGRGCSAAIALNGSFLLERSLTSITGETSEYCGWRYFEEDRVFYSDSAFPDSEGWYDLEVTLTYHTNLPGGASYRIRVLSVCPEVLSANNTLYARYKTGTLDVECPTSDVGGTVTSFLFSAICGNNSATFVYRFP